MRGFGGRIFESNLPPELQEEIERDQAAESRPKADRSRAIDLYLEDSMEPRIAYVHRQQLKSGSCLLALKLIVE